MLTIPTLILTSDTNRASPLRGGGGGGGVVGRQDGGRSRRWRGRRRRNHLTSNNNRAGKYELVARVDAVQL